MASKGIEDQDGVPNKHIQKPLPQIGIFGRSIIPWRPKLLRMDLSVFPIRWDALVM
jgi:hypothetical protein